MTQKEAIIKALEKLGGRSRLKDIYSLAMEFTHFGGATPKNTVRNCLLKSPKDFRRSPGMPSGWWELISYQEEVSGLKKQVEELNEALKKHQSIPTEGEFVKKFLCEVMNDYKRKRGGADPIRNILRHMGQEEAAAVLDAWIDERDEELKNALKKLATLSINVQGDYVLNKNVENEVSGVESGATGIDVRKK